MIKRYAVGISLGAFITFALFYLMQWLILTDKIAIDEDEMGRILDFVRVEEEQELTTTDRRPKPPTPPDTPPPTVLKAHFNDTFDNLDYGIEGMGIDHQIDIKGGGGFVTAGEYLPIVKVAPIYPRRAITQGIEGYVLLEFTVTETGSVIDPVVIEADPPNVFNRAATKAALKFKYKPRVVDGQPVAVAGVQNRIVFELTDD